MADAMVYASAFGIGLLGGMHCVGMCGGIMAALSFALPDQSPLRRIWVLLSYNLGRIGSYMLIALLAGALLPATAAQGLPWLRIVAGLLLIAMGLYLANWWRGLVWLERGGNYLWRYLQPLGKKLMPVKSAPQALLLGAIWGWLPCGLIYSALAYALAAADGNSLQAAEVMLAFGLGTLPAVLASGLVAERLKHWLQNRGLKTLFALSVIGFGLWTVYAALGHVGHSAHHHGSANHAEHQQPVGVQELGSEPAMEHHHHQHHH